jgi:shikimate kinase
MERRIIIIIGPKHSGKTTCAKALEKTLGWEAVDLDELIMLKNGKSPRELFIESPESFKEAEAFALASLLKPEETECPPAASPVKRQSSFIIATGGGLIENSQAMALLSAAASSTRKIITVYLEISAESAWQRITETAAGGKLPPFLNKENPKESHFALHQRRAEACKAAADIIVSSENKNPEDIAMEIAKQLN